MRIVSVCLCIAFISSIFLPTCVGNSTSSIIIIADVHGDINRFKYILQDAGVLDKHNKWCAPPNTTVVQLGDQIDPKTIDSHDISHRHHFKMTYYTDYLKSQASEMNSTFISMIGNHEHMNIDKIRNKTDLVNIIANRPIIHQIGNYIFCHASLKMEHYMLMRDNDMTFADVNSLWYRFVLGEDLSDAETNLLDTLIVGNNSIIYTKTADSKENISSVLDSYGADYMIVGHLVTKYIHLKNRIWYLDQLLKRAFDSYIYSYITITDNDFQVRSLKKYMTYDFILATIY